MAVTHGFRMQSFARWSPGLRRAAPTAAVLTIALGACTSTSPAEPEQSSALLREAQSDGDPDDVALAAKLALQRDPLDPGAHFALASSLARAGELDQATVGFQRTWTLEPTHPVAAYNAGTVYLRRDEPVSAAYWLETALAYQPDHVPTYVNLGKAYYLAGLPELAIAAYDEALRRDPGNRAALANLGAIHGAAGRPERARKYEQMLAGEDIESSPRPDTAGPVAGKDTAGADRENGGDAAGDENPPRSASPAAAGTSPAAGDARAAQPERSIDVTALRELLADLPHVEVRQLAGRATVSGWTRDATERMLLDRVLARYGDVRDLTTADTGDSQRMIEIDATIFYVISSDTESHGFNFLELINVSADFFATDHYRSGAGLTGPGRYTAGDSTVSAGYQRGWFAAASASYDVTIANATDDRVAVLARPHLTTLSGTPATFQSGGELVFRVSGNVSGNIIPFPFGTRLLVTPTLLRTPTDDGGPRVHVVVEAGRMSLLDLLSQRSSSLDDAVVFDKVQVTAEAVLETDQTLILSGLSQKERRTAKSGVPILRDIPVLSYVFSQRSEVDVETSAIILLTPRDPAYVDGRTRAAIDAFIEKRRAYVRARQGSDEDMRRFQERYPDWREIAPNRFASHILLLKTSEAYRKLSGYDLREEDLDLDILDSAWK